MQKTLNYISIQHELGMSTGLDLHLATMLKKFTSVCIRRLGLAGIHYYFLQEDDNTLSPPNSQPDSEIRHYISFPEVQPDCPPPAIPEHIVNQASKSDDQKMSCCANENGFLYYFKLDHIGYIILHRLHDPLDAKIVELLKPVFYKLSISCLASIEHAQLLQVLEAKKHAENTVAFQLNHDDLTALPNRRMLMNQIDTSIILAKQNQFFGAVLFVDLNRFKTVNDTFGHQVGDLLLRSVASILKNHIRQNDFVARLSGDEFVILLRNIGTDKNAGIDLTNKIIGRIQQVFLTSIKAGEHLIYITPSIGVALFPDNTSSAEQILRNADSAMYQAKSSTPNSSAYYDHNLSSEIEQRLLLETELKNAVRDMQQFQLYYQPQFNENRECIGAEALIRWNNPEQGMVRPDLFIPIAEETGLMLDIGDWVISQACDHIHLLESLSLPISFSKIAINVSAVQFNQEMFVDRLYRLVKKSAINPMLLAVELTESSIISNVTEAVQKMIRLKEYGIGFSIDDFGTGYSSLSYLTKFPIDTLKIDRAFITNIHLDAGNRAIVNAIIALGRSLGIDLIAEGVETDEELDILGKAGCHHYQGYYFERPMPFDEFRELVTSKIHLKT